MRATLTERQALELIREIWNGLPLMTEDWTLPQLEEAMMNISHAVDRALGEEEFTPIRLRPRSQ